MFNKELHPVDLKFIGFYISLLLLSILLYFEKLAFANIFIPLVTIMIRDLYRSSTNKGGKSDGKVPGSK